MRNRQLPLYQQEQMQNDCDVLKHYPADHDTNIRHKQYQNESTIDFRKLPKLKVSPNSAHIDIDCHFQVYGQCVFTEYKQVGLIVGKAQSMALSIFNQVGFITVKAFHNGPAANHDWSHFVIEIPKRLEEYARQRLNLTPLKEKPLLTYIVFSQENAYRIYDCLLHPFVTGEMTPPYEYKPFLWKETVAGIDRNGNIITHG